MSKKLSDEERFQLDLPPDDGEGYGEPTRDPTWQELAQAYITEHGEKIKALDARLTELERKH